MEWASCMVDSLGLGLATGAVCISDSVASPRWRVDFRGRLTLLKLSTGVNFVGTFPA